MSTTDTLDRAYAGEPFARSAKTADRLQTLDVAYAGEPFVVIVNASNGFFFTLGSPG